MEVHGSGEQAQGWRQGSSLDSREAGRSGVPWGKDREAQVLSRASPGGGSLGASPRH